ncbi:L,D-transpeptidase family protein [soil metagenome]
MFRVSVLIVGLLWVTLAQALVLPIPQGKNNVVGGMQRAYIEPGDTVSTVARRYDMGALELLLANPKLRLNQVLKTWDKVLIPSAFIIPDVPHQGIVINLAELRLYYFPPGRPIVLTYPLGIGKEGWETPLGATEVLSKKEEPEWRVPESIRFYLLEEKGIQLPEVVPPGPENPLGHYAMRLALSGYLIHGTNNPSSIGLRSSSGCIRLYPEDIQQLFSQVRPGTKVTIIHEPYKLGWNNNKLYIEAHDPLPDYETFQFYDSNLSDRIDSIVNQQTQINRSYVQMAIKGHVGYPQLIGQGV